MHANKLSGLVTWNFNVQEIHKELNDQIVNFRHKKTPIDESIEVFELVRKERLELSHQRHQNLNLACLPIPPLPRISCLITQTTYKIWWPHLESNQGHKDFQSFALPTELCGQNRMGVLYGWALRVSNVISLF